MTDKNFTPKCSPFHGLTPESRTRINSKLVAIETSIRRHADNESKEVAKMFEALNGYVTAIKGSLSRESGTATVKPTEQPHSAVVAVNNWLSAMPRQFPDYMPFDPAKTIPFKNPFISDEPADSHRAVHNGLAFLIEVALPWPGNDIFRLDEAATRGFVDYLMTLQGAMEFELEHRRDGGIPTDLEDEEDAE